MNNIHTLYSGALALRLYFKIQQIWKSNTTTKCNNQIRLCIATCNYSQEFTHLIIFIFSRTADNTQMQSKSQFIENDENVGSYFQKNVKKWCYIRVKKKPKLLKRYVHLPSSIVTEFSHLIAISTSTKCWEKNKLSKVDFFISPPNLISRPQLWKCWP